MFLRNAWYVAATENEITDKPVPVRILSEKIVLFRKTDGQVAALEDACPHRKLPLSMGRIKGDQIECGYHGMMFDCSGSCTHAPATDRPPWRAGSTTRRQGQIAKAGFRGFQPVRMRLICRKIAVKFAREIRCKTP